MSEGDAGAPAGAALAVAGAVRVAEGDATDCSGQREGILPGSREHLAGSRASVPTSKRVADYSGAITRLRPRRSEAPML